MLKHIAILLVKTDYFLKNLFLGFCLFKCIGNSIIINND